jgi:hypothetical protein
MSRSSPVLLALLVISLAASPVPGDVCPGVTDLWPSQTLTPSGTGVVGLGTDLAFFGVVTAGVEAGSDDQTWIFDPETDSWVPEPVPAQVGAPHRVARTSNAMAITRLAPNWQVLLFEGRGHDLVAMRNLPGEPTAVALEPGIVAVGSGLASSFDGEVWIFEERFAGWDASPTVISLPFAGTASRFGWDVAFGQWEGERILVVGAPGKETDTTSAIAGAVYEYRQDDDDGSWVPFDSVVSPLVGDDALFGFSVDVEAGLLVVGAPGFDIFGEDIGTVHSFAREPDDSWAWEGAFFSPDPAAGKRFGSDVDLSGIDLLATAPGSSIDDPLDTAPATRQRPDRTHCSPGGCRGSRRRKDRGKDGGRLAWAYR